MIHMHTSIRQILSKIFNHNVDTIHAPDNDFAAYTKDVSRSVGQTSRSLTWKSRVERPERLR